MTKTLVNVCGASRTGTTMLDLMLGNSEDAFSCGEVYAWFRPWRKHHFTLKCSCGDTQCDKWKDIRVSPEYKFHTLAFEKLNIKFIIDSSKDEVWLIDTMSWAEKENFKVINILLWKDPVDLAYSWWKRGKGAVFWRKQFIDYYKKIKQSNLPVVTVNYSKFMENPALNLRKICDIVGMEYFEGKENFWEKEHHYLFGSMGTLKQVRNKSSSLSREVELDKDFISEVKESKALEDNQEVDCLITWLKSKDFSLARQVNKKECNEKINYPFWYFYLKVKRKIRQFIPQNIEWHYDK